MVIYLLCQDALSFDAQTRVSGFLKVSIFFGFSPRENDDDQLHLLGILVLVRSSKYGERSVERSGVKKREKCGQECREVRESRDKKLDIWLGK